MLGPLGNKTIGPQQMLAGLITQKNCFLGVGKAFLTQINHTMTMKSIESIDLKINGCHWITTVIYGS
jgi:hypothetical protein